MVTVTVLRVERATEPKTEMVGVVRRAKDEEMVAENQPSLVSRQYGVMASATSAQVELDTQLAQAVVTYKGKERPLDMEANTVTDLRLDLGCGYGAGQGTGNKDGSGIGSLFGAGAADFTGVGDSWYEIGRYPQVADHGRGIMGAGDANGTGRDGGPTPNAHVTIHRGG